MLRTPQEFGFGAERYTVDALMLVVEAVHGAHNPLTRDVKIPLNSVT